MMPMMIQPKTRATTFSVSNTKRTCFRSHRPLPQSCPDNLTKRIFSLRWMSSVFLNNQRQLPSLPNLWNFPHADAIESSVRRNIVSASGMGASALKSVFVLTVVINLWSPVSKLTWRSFGKYHTCSIASAEQCECMIF